ncbi:MAG: glycerophosphodiester phosphodiesterase [Betaproteobacteria bacterium]|nr:glycerophosphodiester phosphodiesterase [Betaproteobacteria bacterium]
MSRWRYPRIVAHRGGGSFAPENTLAALRFGAALGFKGVEFDVMLSGDGTPVLIHDETLERTTGVSGEVARTPYAELARLDAGAWLGERWRGERIPSFEQAARVCRELGLWANVEIKPAAGHERATGEAAARLAAELWRGAELPPLLSSFSREALDAARSAAPGLPRGCLVEDVPADWLARVREFDCVSLHCDHRSLTQPLARGIHAAGCAILCWTVNDPRVARELLSWGADCLVTDALDVITAAFV